MKYMHMISRERDHSEGRGWGSKAIWNFSENSSVLVASPVPYHWQQTFSLVVVSIYFKKSDAVISNDW